MMGCKEDKRRVKTWVSQKGEQQKDGKNSERRQ